MGLGRNSDTIVCVQPGRHERGAGNFKVESDSICTVKFIGFGRSISSVTFPEGMFFDNCSVLFEIWESKLAAMNVTRALLFGWSQTAS